MNKIISDLESLQKENKTLTELAHNFAKELTSLRKENENIKILLATARMQLAWLANEKNYYDPAFDPSSIAQMILEELSFNKDNNE